ncbi:MAG TPA: glutathione S-transferase N-terminal domain-containing protein [Candidatus Gastranaerophilaceae bacterium]|nr:glutathione S-transferase N-terminal domain-containing protein [Candidatus Gastranaerophilaceae bacterium]
MLLLYVLEGCPYCKKVITHLEEKNIEHRRLDVNDPVNMDELLHLGREDQVPFLVDTEHNVKMYESDEIIQYIDTL